MESVNSTTFIKRPPCMTETQEKYLYTKELLTGRIFLGFYKEKRYVTVLKEYRDVVIIAPEEAELQHDLEKLRKKWFGVRDIKWVGITGPDSLCLPKSYCFWVKLNNLAFGHYWFQIKHVKFVEAEIFLQLKYVRKSHVPLPSEFSQKSTIEFKIERGEASTSDSLNWDLDPNKLISSFQTTCRNTIQTVYPLLTWKNLLSVMKGFCVLIIVLVMGALSVISHLGDFVLKLIRELSLLVNAITPIVIQFIDFLSKVIGGLYILVAGMFLRNANHHNAQRRPHQNVHSIPYMAVAGDPFQPPPFWRERNRMLREELFSNPE